jgi:HSP20 family molecular chaperone IbpA
MLLEYFKSKSLRVSSTFEEHLKSSQLFDLLRKVGTHIRIQTQDFNSFIHNTSQFKNKQEIYYRYNYIPLTNHKAKTNMMIYRESPFTSPVTFDWTPYIFATTPNSCSRECIRECISKKQKTDKNDVNNGTPTATKDSKIIYQDRNTRIQHTDDNQIEFSIDVPGVKASNIKVEIHDGVLKILAERKHRNNNTIKFERQFLIKHLTETESNKIHATLVDGVLQVTVPKRNEEEEESKQISVPIVAEYPPENDQSDDQKKDVRFTTDLPGVSSTNVTLQVKGDTITLDATRKVMDHVSKIDRYFSFDTNKIDPKSFHAYLIDGVLTIIGLKKDVPEPKQIVVLDGSVTETMTIDVAENDTMKKDDEDMVIVETVTDEK